MSMPVHAIWLCICLSSCAGTMKDPLASQSGNPDCGSDALVKLSTGRAIEMEQACRPYQVKDCAPGIKQPVIDKWAPKFDAWEKCQ